jgi:transposase
MHWSASLMPFVASLSLAELGFGRAVAAATGRPGYHPGDLLRLYIWGYLNQVRSSRHLERACVRDLEALWLMRRLAPDYRTIASFRHDNPEAKTGQRCARSRAQRTLQGADRLARERSAKRPDGRSA